MQSLFSSINVARVWFNMCAVDQMLKWMSVGILLIIMEHTYGENHSMAFILCLCVVARNLVCKYFICLTSPIVLLWIATPREANVNLEHYSKNSQFSDRRRSFCRVARMCQPFCDISILHTVVASIIQCVYVKSIKLISVRAIST